MCYRINDLGTICERKALKSIVRLNKIINLRVENSLSRFHVHMLQFVFAFQAENDAIGKNLKGVGSCKKFHIRPSSYFNNGMLILVNRYKETI